MNIAENLEPNRVERERAPRLQQTQLRDLLQQLRKNFLSPSVIFSPAAERLLKGSTAYDLTGGEVQQVVIDIATQVNEGTLRRLFDSQVSQKYSELQRYFEPLLDNKELVREAQDSELR